MSIVLFCVLGCLLLLGDDKQSIVLITSSAGVIGLFAYDWYMGTRTYKMHNTILVSWFVVFAALCLSSLSALSVGFAVWDSIKYIIAFLLFIFFSNRKEHGLQSRFLRELSNWTVLVLAVSYAFEYFPLLQSTIPKMNLLYKSYGHSHVVNILVFTLPYLLMSTMKTKSLRTTGFLLFVLMGIITSYARGLAVLLSASSVVFVFVGMKNRLPLKLDVGRLLHVCKILLLGGGLLISAMILYRQVSPIITRPPLSKTTIFESRIGYWKQSILAIQDRPLFGSGPGSYYLVSKRYQDEQNRYSWFAHSYPLQTFVELGLVGFVCVAILLYVTITHGQQTIGEADHHHPAWIKQSILFGAILSLGYSFIEMNLDFTVVWLIFWIFLGLLSQPRYHSDAKNTQNREISVVIPIIFLCIFYGCAVVAAALQLQPGGIKFALKLMPHDAGLAEKYLDYSTIEKNQPIYNTETIYLFHQHNSEILAKIANTTKEAQAYDYYMYKAIQNDPKNRSLIESYVTEVGKKNIPTGIFRVVRLLIMNISIDKKSDTKFIDDNWSRIQECFNEETLLWVDPPYTDTYEAKTLYFAALCLVKSKKIQEARSLLKIAVNSRPSWSNIYIDYAALIWWNGSDKQLAIESIEMCKNNKNARNHCSQFDQNLFLETSVYDVTVRLKN